MKGRSYRKIENYVIEKNLIKNYFKQTYYRINAKSESLPVFKKVDALCLSSSNIGFAVGIESGYFLIVPSRVAMNCSKMAVWQPELYILYH